MARLQRMETTLAKAADEALLEMHADLVSRLIATGDLDARRSALAAERIERVLERLPPPAAGTAEIEGYLEALIRWLSSDPWPRDRQFGGPVLAPAAVERRLRVSAHGQTAGQALDADRLARRCRRLVILGGPGSGKTWFAKRTARLCAEDALAALAARQKP